MHKKVKTYGSAREHAINMLNKTFDAYKAKADDCWVFGMARHWGRKLADATHTDAEIRMNKSELLVDVGLLVSAAFATKFNTKGGVDGYLHCQAKGVIPEDSDFNPEV